MLSLNHSASHLSRTMASEDDTNTQQNTKEEKPNVQTMQIIVRAQVKRSSHVGVVSCHREGIRMTWVAQDGSELQFKIKRTTPLMKVTLSRSCYVMHVFTFDTPGMNVFNMCTFCCAIPVNCYSILWQQVFVAYCSRKGLTLEDCRFVADGNLLTAKGNEVTPEEVYSSQISATNGNSPVI